VGALVGISFHTFVGFNMQRLMKARGKKGLKILGTRRAAEISLLQLVCCVVFEICTLPPPPFKTQVNMDIVM
jgi:hypothetical protein